jgi:diguanylate cyclase (GGDEF)-like protein/PAS domain S-box-containing protein
MPSEQANPVTTRPGHIYRWAADRASRNRTPRRHAFLIACWLLSTLWALPAPAAQSVPIFILHSYSQEYPWTKRQHQGFMRTLSAADPAAFTASVEYLDTKRVPYTPAYADLFARHLAQKYAGFEPKIIYVTDDNAMSFALSHLARIFPGAPIFFSGVNDYEIKERIDRQRVTGVFERKEIGPNLDLMRYLVPGTRDILVVGDESETFQAIGREIASELELRPEIQAQFIASNHIERLTEWLRGRSERFVFLTTLGAMSDGTGRLLTLPETVSAIVRAGPFIVVSMEDVYMYPGVLGGYVTSGHKQGEVAAAMVLRHLAGAPLADLAPVETSPNEYLIDGTELEKTGLTLPPPIAARATIVNEPETFYERNLQVIVPSLYAFAVLFVLSLAASLYLVLRKNRQIAKTSTELAAQTRLMAEVQESLTRAQRIARMGNWDWRLKDNTLYWSEGIYRLFGVEPAGFDASYEGFLARVHPDDRLAVSDAVRTALEQAARYDVTHRIVRPNGEIRIVRENGEIVCDRSGQPERMIGTVQDVTEQTRIEQALRESEQKLRTVIEGFPVVLWAIDRDGRFTLSRGAGLKLLGLEPDQVVGRSLFDVYRDYPEIMQDARRVLAGESLVSTRWVGQLAFEVHYSPLRDPGGAVAGAIGVAADVTERKRSEERLAFLANYDPVTGLPNRNLFTDRLAQALRNAERRGTRLALLFLDLDSFKTVNDSLGHAAGDTLLTQVADRLTSVIRTADTVSRLGGDEFTIILENLARDEDAARVAQKIGEQSSRPYQIMSREVFVSTSIGIALYPSDGNSVDTLLMTADAAMYRAKASGPNSYQFYTKLANAGARDRLELGSELRRALERGEFALHYQPQVTAQGGRIVGFEALLRWRSPARGEVAPSVFVPILEETGLIVPVGEWVLREACKWASALAPGGEARPLISVNLSARQFAHPDLYRAVEAALAASRLPAQRLELEITESSLIDPQMNIETMDRLKALGARLTIDDFGTGYSSLAYLKRFPIDRLKIDASFVRDVARDRDDAAISAAIIGLGRTLGLRVVAEGVETAAQLDFLRRQGCDEIQGFLVAKPMTGDDAIAWLQSLRSGAAHGHFGQTGIVIGFAPK